MVENAEKYTSETREWLNKRFDLFDSENVYIPNQPVYGFSALAFRLEEYARMYAVLRVLNRLRFDSLVDIGCADGFGPALAKHLFNCQATGFDLSDRAVRRSVDLFDISGAAADAHDLPLPDNSVDVTVCTEVLEHVIRPEKVVSELKRISRRFVVISTPRAPNENARKQHFDTLDPNEPHAHIHYFTDKEMLSLVGHDAWHFGARTRIADRIFNRIAWGDQSTIAQRESYFQFTIESAELSEKHKRTMREMLLDRYTKNNVWKKRLVSWQVIGWLLHLDAVLASSCRSLAHDHLVIIPTSTESQWKSGQISYRRIQQALLGKFSVPPLKRRSQ